MIPPKIKALVHTRLKYACPCCKQYLVTAGKPAQPIEKSIASPGLLAFVATQKYCDVLPLYRQTEMFKRIGIELDRTRLAHWMIKCGELVQPLINLLQEQLLARPLVHMDETTVQVLKEPGKTGKADRALAFIQKLYVIEKRIKDKPPDEKYKIRQQEARSLIDKLRQWREKVYRRCRRKPRLARHYIIYTINGTD